jgi:hypothetical protein
MNKSRYASAGRLWPDYDKHQAGGWIARSVKLAVGAMDAMQSQEAHSAAGPSCLRGIVWPCSTGTKPNTEQTWTN